MQTVSQLLEMATPDSSHLVWFGVSLASTALSAVIAGKIVSRKCRIRADAALEASRSSKALIMVDGGRLTAADDSFARLVGRRQGDLLGRAIETFFPTLTDIADLATKHGAAETALKVASGEHRPVTVAVTPGDQTGAFAIEVICADSAAAMEAQVAYLSEHDALTGLANLPAFIEAGAKRLIEAAPFGRRLALAEIDLVRFRAVNDVMGRRFGDRALVQIARRLEDAATSDTLIGRLGGDRFAVLLPVVGPNSAVAHDVARLMQAATGAIDTPEGLVEVAGRASIAVLDPPLLGASEEDDAILARTLFEHGIGLVEATMNRAKRDSTPRVVIYDPAEDQAQRERGELALALPRALALVDKVFSVHYQPQAKLEGAPLGPDGAPRRRSTDPKPASSDKRLFGEIIGFEALLRGSLPGRGPVAPGELIPVAEETNAILPLGEWVLRRSCADAMQWPDGISVAVNLSPIQLRHDGVVQMVASALRESGLPARRLELEITETAMIDDLDRAVAVMSALRDMGVSLAIDDFGAGFTSLRTLKAFRFDKIKLDRAFVTDVTRDAQTAAIVRAVVSLGVELKTPVLAEGVETLDELRALEAIGCATAQGYLIGRPASLEATLELLALRQDNDGDPEIASTGDHAESDAAAESQTAERLRIVSSQ